MKYLVANNIHKMFSELIKRNKWMKIVFESNTYNIVGFTIIIEH